jgi:very-short-patch-repair endonuclease
MEKINEINNVIAAYFALNKSIEIVPAKDLMPYFIKAGIFPKDNKNGLPIRTILRKLDSNNELYKIPSIIAERKDKNINWFFGRNVQSKVVPFEKSKAIKPSIIKTGATGKRKDSDEHYIIDLCDELLKIKGSRQHRFSFLVGDSGTKLPVDVYYETLNLVVEFNEQQHTKAVAHFDKPNKMTVSGVHRGEQRKIYDQRRLEVLPKHGIKVIEISFNKSHFFISSQCCGFFLFIPDVLATLFCELSFLAMNNYNIIITLLD